MKKVVLTLMAILMLGFVSTLSALTYTIETQPDQDGFVANNGDINTTDGTALSGGLPGNIQRCAIFMVALTNYPLGTVDSAELSLVFNSDESGKPGADLTITSFADKDDPGELDSNDYSEAAVIINGSSQEVFLASSTTPAAGERVTIDITDRVNAALKNDQDYLNVRLDDYSPATETPYGRIFRTSSWAGNAGELTLEIGQTVIGDVTGQAGNGFILYNTNNNSYAFWTTDANTKVGDEAEFLAYRAIYKMQLPELPAGQMFYTAKFQYNYDSKFSTPWTNINIVCYESSSNYICNADFFDDTSALEFETDITPTSSGNTIHTLQATSLDTAINNAYKQGKSFISFRMQMNGENLTSGTSAQVYFISSSNYPDENKQPKLVIDTIPEPPPTGTVLIVE
ncbi:MAG: hypothetical protein PF692_11515 [Kiritimatiellae bacterium]|jgi:hypothetical protein|nr:hypothetical protein [Kiritimatiellia bacterium]